MVFEIVTNDDVIPPLIFPYVFRLNMKGFIKCLDEVVPVWIERVAAGSPYIWQQDSASYHTNVGCENISATTSLLTSGCLTIQIAIPLIIMCGVLLSGRLTKLLAMSKMN